MVSLGTDGFGRSEGRAQLRDFFEVDSRYIALATLYALAQEGQLESKVVTKAIKDLEIDPDKVDPATA
jgi:pyruvate dehydrogenase E1 component